VAGILQTRAHARLALRIHIWIGSPVGSIAMRASGPFDVKLTSLPAAPGIESANLGRMTLDKRFHGDLDASSLGEMLSAGDPGKGSAGYVAMERVIGVLQGRRGSFVLQHSASMNRGASTLSISVVPESGTDELTGLSGSMQIQIEQGKHFYVFDYDLT
jgi:hypothetical protein